MRATITSCFLALLVGLANAAEPVVPAIEAGDMRASAAPASPGVEPVNLLAGEDSELSARERANVEQARRFVQDAPDLTAVGDGGAVVFEYGTSYPTIVCAVLTVCDVQLQPGEMVKGDFETGDKVRWSFKLSASGTAPNLVPHIIIKPKEIGLTTNLTVFTDRRVYRMKLVSRKDDFMPFVAFSYPDDDAVQWAEAAAALAAPAPAAAMSTSEAGSAAALDFGFRISGDKPRWRPLRVYSDGRQTFIQMPAAMASGDAPVLVVMGPGRQEEMVNYRLIGDRFIVDRVIDRAMLVDGVGRHQVRVDIQRDGGV